MANTLLTPDMITREALRVLHQKLNFIGNINRSYDDSFAQSGAKIGSALRIRLPNQYTVTDGRVMTAQDTTNTSVTLNVTNRKHVGLNFTDEELTMSIDNFSELHIQPAMAVLAANIESDVLQNVYKDVYNQVDSIDAAMTYQKLLLARKSLVDNLTPMDTNVACCLDTQAQVDLLDAFKGLFTPSDQLGKSFREGTLGRAANMNFFENTLMPVHTTGTAASSTGYLSNGATQSGSTITIDTGTTTFAAGDIITFAGVYSVHPETKVSTGVLKTFVVTAATGTSATSLSISPSIVTSGALQNVSNAIADNSAIVKQGGASAVSNISLAFHRDAFAFATADLEMPRNVEGSRQVYDGISMRYVRQFDINNSADRMRIDVLYGYKTIRPQLACRIASN